METEVDNGVPAMLYSVPKSFVFSPLPFVTVMDCYLLFFVHYGSLHVNRDTLRSAEERSRGRCLLDLKTRPIMSGVTITITILVITITWTSKPEVR